LWTELINKYRGLDAPWSADVVGRALGNRGNSRARQGRLEAALEDFDAAIALCPWAVDPVLNRGVALEGLERWNDAIRRAGWWTHVQAGAEQFRIRRQHERGPS
jgi:tetratricopeptide (TPR) repeat protein